MEVAKVLGVVSSESLAYPNRLKIRGLCTIVGWFKLDVYLKPLTLQEDTDTEREREREWRRRRRRGSFFLPLVNPKLQLLLMTRQLLIILCTDKTVMGRRR